MVLTSDRPTPDSRRRLPAALALIAILIVVLAVGALLSRFGARLPVEALASRLVDAGPAGAAGLVLAGAFATGLGLPRQAVALIAGYAYGAAGGLALALLAASGGCLMTVLVSRHLLAAAVRSRFPGLVRTLGATIENDAFWKVLLLRFQPFGTNLATNLCAGVVPIRLDVFLAASVIGYVPQTLVFVLAGSGLRVESGAELFVAAVLFVVSAVLAGWLWRRHSRRIARNAVAIRT